MTKREAPEIAPLDQQPLYSRLLLRVIPTRVIQFLFGARTEKRERFEQLVTSVENDVTVFRHSIAERADLERFLTTPERASLEDELDDIRADVATIRTTTWPFHFTEEDVERLDTLREDLQSAVNRLYGYNDEFIRRQIEAHRDLFTNVDADGNDLTREQCQAVIRNDIANQVIAGAGTGKTLTLTHRIAYLIERGTPPERIAAITLTNKATDEIEDRLASRFGITEVDVRTIHSFANRIAQNATEEHVTTVDQSDKRDFIEEELRNATHDADSDLAGHYRQFLAHYKASMPAQEAFESREAYVAARAESSYETLGGEEVASQAEKVIADFLFTHRVDYRYESIAGWAETAADKRAYKPDFYLPEYDIYIEHWGLDENGEIAPWSSWSTAEYLEKLRWARRQFAQSHRTLVETYDFEQQAGRLERALEHRLRHHGVSLSPMGTEELVDYVLEEYEREQTIVSRLVAFVDNAKMFDVPPAEARSRLPRNNPRLYHFGMCGAILLERYEAWLADHRFQDFHDMIYNAIEAIERNPSTFRSRYDHLLVDEFQDVAISQIRLIQALTRTDEGARLFCVGDDWQSIYAFRGAVVEYFVDFEEYFGPATRTALTRNYRCPSTIVDASTRLIQQNPAQLEKEIEPMVDRDTTPRVHTIKGYNDWAYAERVGEQAAELAARYLDAGSDPDDIMVLSRYDAGAPYTDLVKDALEDREIPYDGNGDRDTYRPPEMQSPSHRESEMGVSVFSAHQAKGREAPHVILLHVATGPAGFSPETKSDDLVNPIRDIPANTAAEERRLFYVALTRAEQSLDILTRRNQHSAFLDEISSYLAFRQSTANPGRVGEQISLTAKVEKLWKDTHPKKEQAGLLKDGTGTIKFVAWASVSPPQLQENVWYDFHDLEVSEYSDELELHFTSQTQVNRLTGRTLSKTT